MEFQKSIHYKLSSEQEIFFSFVKNPQTNIFIEKEGKLKEDPIIKLIQRHRLVPFFYKNKDKLTRSLQDYLHTQFLKNTQQVLLFANEIFSINEVCLQNKIELVFLKGPVLSYYLHGDFSSRQMIDIDIFADKTHLKNVHEILLKLGYKPTEIPKSRFRKFILKDNYYYHPQKQVSLEIHYRFFPNKYLDNRFKSLFSKLTMPFKIQNREIKILNNEANLIFLVLHGSNHQWFRLFWLKDLADFISGKSIDWDKVAGYSKKLGIENALIQSVILSNTLFGTMILSEINKIKRKNRTLKLLTNKAMKAIISPVQESTLRRINRLFYLLRISNKLGFKLHTLLGGVLRFIGR